MNFPRFSTTISGLLFVSLMAAVEPAAQCTACDWGATWCAWQRTWYAPHALETPLRDYYIPRLPGRCDRAGYADGGGYAGSCGCVAPIVNGDGAAEGTNWPGAPKAFAACDPVRFERLGQIPNDLELSLSSSANRTKP